MDFEAVRKRLKDRAKPAPVPADDDVPADAGPSSGARLLAAIEAKDADAVEAAIKACAGGE